jgi:gamma-glutamyltranspeptidase/glutathione hydrolase
MGILEKGGNAFDAAVATAFTLQVVEPHLNGPGGDVPIIVHDVKRGRTEVICGQGPAPAGATIAHYKSEGLEMVPGTGLLAACIPGTFESWMLLLRDYGTMRLRDVLEPAIAYARDGYPLVERVSATIATVEQLFRKYWKTSAAVYLPNDEVPKPGTLFTNKTLSETYARILSEAESAGADRVAQIEHARKAWSHGFVAEAIGNFFRTQEVMDVSGSPATHHRGAADLRLRPLHRLQGRRLEPGSGHAAATRAVEGFSTRRARPRRSRIHSSADRMRQARLCRPREVLWRSEIHRDPDRDAVVRRL